MDTKAEQNPSNADEVAAQSSNTKIAPTIEECLILLQQLESRLKFQIELCSFYSGYFRNQDNKTMADTFENNLESTKNDLQYLISTIKPTNSKPQFSEEEIIFSSLPTNVDVKDNELRIEVESCSFPSAAKVDIYVVGEFEFPIQQDETITDYVSRWFKNVRIEPSRVLCCLHPESRQLDKINGTNVTQYNSDDDKILNFDRPMSFFVCKGKSRSFKRKFKPVKLTFYQRVGLGKPDRRLGQLIVKVDKINDEATHVVRLFFREGRRQNEQYADIKIKVRQPLADLSIKTHSEKLLRLVHD